jgi:hypothetical protein
MAKRLKPDQVAVEIGASHLRITTSDADGQSFLRRRLPAYCNELAARPSCHNESAACATAWCCALANPSRARRPPPGVRRAAGLRAARAGALL